MRIALVGYGGVGRAFVKLLADKKEDLKKDGINIDLIYVINSRGGIYNPLGIDCKHLSEFSMNERDITKYPYGGDKNIKFPTIIFRRDIDLIVEMTPTDKETGEPGMTHITEALKSGIHVVTANKGPVLLNYKGLKELSAKNNVHLGIGCTTGGALPTVNGGTTDMAGAKILGIEGVLNGTTNFILTEMEESGVSYEEALKTAKELGIAETDPYLDVEGWDAAIKLLILTNILMKQEKTLKDISVEGITNITLEDIKAASKEGKRYKLIGRSVFVDGEIKMTVKLEKIGEDHQLYNVVGKDKGVKYSSDILGDLTMIGGVSGVSPAAAAVLRDIININRIYI